MDFLNSLFSGLIQDPVFMGAVAVLVAVALAFFAVWLGSALQKDARLAKWVNVWKLAIPYASDLMLAIRTEGLDMSAVSIGGKVVDYNELAATSLERLGRQFDARMLYTIDATELAVFNKFGLKFEFDQFWPRFEAEYQRLRLSPNGITMNDKDAPAVVQAVEGPPTVLVSYEIQKTARAEAQRQRREREKAQADTTLS